MSKKAKLLRKEQLSAYKLILPTIIILIMIAIYPLGHVFVTSFTDKEFASPRPTSFIGAENYRQLLSVRIIEVPPLFDDSGAAVIDENGQVQYERTIRVLPREPVRYKEWKQFSLAGKRYVIGARDPDFIDAISNTLTFTVISVILELILGLTVAMVVNSEFKGRGMMRTVMLVPWAVITVVSARMWEWMLQPTRAGLFNTILAYAGVGEGGISFLSSETTQLASMIAIDVWKTTPYMALLLLAGLQQIPTSLYEAADIDGAGAIRKFTWITIPLLKPAIAVALIFRTLDALRVFDLFQVLLGSRKYSMASYNYFQLIGNRNMGLASAIGVVIFILIMIFAILFIKSMGVNEND